MYVCKKFFNRYTQTEVEGSLQCSFSVPHVQCTHNLHWRYTPCFTKMWSTVGTAQHCMNNPTSVWVVLKDLGSIRSADIFVRFSKNESFYIVNRHKAYFTFLLANCNRDILLLYCNGRRPRNLPMTREHTSIPFSKKSTILKSLSFQTSGYIAL